MPRSVLLCAASLCLAACFFEDECRPGDVSCGLLPLLAYYPWQASCEVADASSQTWSTFFTDPTDSEFGFDLCGRGGSIFLLGQANLPFPSYSGLTSTTPLPTNQSMVAARYSFSGQAQSFAYIGADPGTLNTAAMAPSFDGGVLLLGSADSAVSNLSATEQKRAFLGVIDGAIVKMSASGVVEWYSHLGGSGDDALTAAAAAPLGGYFLAGYSDSADALSDIPARLPPTGERQAWLVRVDRNGNPLWQTYLGGAGVDRLDGVYALADGGVVVVGSAGASFSAGGLNAVQSFAGASDLLLARLDGEGRLLWFTFFGDGANQNGRALAIVGQTIVAVGSTAGGPASFNGLMPYTTGGGASEGLYVEFDLNGRTTRYGFVGDASNDVLTALLPSPAGGFLLAGYSGALASLDGKTPLRPNAGLFDFILIHFSAPGAAIDWWSFYGSAGQELAARLIRAQSGDLLLNGNSTNPILGGPAPIIPPGGGGDDAALFRVRSSGEF